MSAICIGLTVREGKENNIAGKADLQIFFAFRGKDVTDLLPAA
ncbi:MAG: hypothetical protein ACOYXB_12990 [Bacteroidota bacterium]